MNCIATCARTHCARGLFDANNQWFFLPRQRFHALWQPDVGLTPAFSGAKYASDAMYICAKSYQIRSNDVIKNNKC
jgi:hypothetical protein